jgi:transglutaminase-like putative cysteine protease
VGLAASAPAWLQAQLNAPLPDHDDETGAVRLYDENVLTVQANGRFKRLRRSVYRILRREGETRAIARVDFDTRTTRITGLRGWSVGRDGKVVEVGERDAVESSLPGILNGELVSDVRSRLLRIPSGVPGSVVGYEIESDEQPYALQDEWRFQDTVPVREAHYTLQLPPGWQYKAMWINRDGEAAASGPGGVWQWLLKDIKPIPIDEDMPPLQAVAGGLLISLQPPSGQDPGFQDWRGMGAWYLKLTHGRREPSADIKQKVVELTQTSPTQLGKMQALARFVQEDIRYVAIELGIGGYQPHAASEVYGHRYGDCKDKVTLLGSMLQEIGIDSYYVAVNSRRGSITEKTPASLGFNHVILAIRLPEGLTDPTLLAVMPHSTLGRVLFFDPTDSLTPLGRIAGRLQGGYGLLVVPDGGELVRLPQLPVEANAVQRTAQLTLDETGKLNGEVREVFLGDPAVRQRSAFRSTSQDTDQIKVVESRLAQSLATFTILKASVANRQALDMPFQWNYAFEVDRYAKASGDLLTVRPWVFGSKSSGLLETTKPRRQPIEFDCPERDTDVFEIALPPGYEVDDLPPAVDAEYEFGSYHSKTELAGRTLRYTRSFEIRDLTVPVSKAEELKQFYRTIYNDERMLAVLRRARS